MDAWDSGRTILSRFMDRVTFQKLFQRTAKNLASRDWLVKVEVSSKSVRKLFIKSMPKRG
jgi:hypothetical protein